MNQNTAKLVWPVEQDWSFPFVKLGNLSVLSEGETKDHYALYLYFVFYFYSIL